MSKIRSRLPRHEQSLASTEQESNSSKKDRRHSLRHYGLLIFCFAACLLFLPSRNNLVTMSADSTHYLREMGITTTTIQKTPRLGDGCYHVFLDVGANVGVHGRFLLEPSKYPNSWHAVQLFQKEYGLQDNRNVCVFEFEANDRHWPRLNELSKAYTSMGWRYHLVEAAVSDLNGSFTFYHQGTEDLKHNEWGFSGAFRDTTMAGGSAVEVPTVRLSEWIQTHIHERMLPEQPPNERTTPVLGMKMDIEGYEYVVLPDLLHSGVLCQFDFAMGEFHERMAPLEFQTDGYSHRTSLQTEQQAKDFGDALVQVMHGSRHCPVRWLSIDDESYLHDGQPLPTPNRSTR